jgi:hypothetical protein
LSSLHAQRRKLVVEMAALHKRLDEVDATIATAKRVVDQGRNAASRTTPRRPSKALTTAELSYRERKQARNSDAGLRVAASKRTLSAVRAWGS